MAMHNSVDNPSARSNNPREQQFNWKRSRSEATWPYESKTPNFRRKGVLTVRTTMLKFFDILQLIVNLT